MADWEGFSKEFREKRGYSKRHRREFIETHWLEILSEDIIEGVANHNPKAFEIAHAILNHMETNQEFYKEAI